MCLPFLHEYVVAPADKASNNIVFLCKSYFTMSVSSKNLAFPRTLVILFTKILVFNKEEIWANHRSFVSSINIPINKVYDDLKTPP